jgi:Ca-activated chloride channel family protein
MRHLSTSLALLGSVATAVAVAVACGSQASGTSPGGGDNFAGGSEPLALNPAPPGLCSGDGSEKECDDPAGCGAGGGNGAGSGAMGGSAGAGAVAGSAGSWGAGGGDWGGAGEWGGGGAAGDWGAGGAGGGAGTGAAGSSSSGGTGGSVAGDASAPPGCDAGTPEGGPDGCDDAGTGEAGTPEAAARELRPQSQAPGACEGLPQTEAAKLYLSADDSSSTASPALVRKLIRSGQRVPPGVVRPYEFLNYYDFDFEPAAPGEVRIVPLLSSCPKDGELSFQVALQAEARANDERAPLSVTFVLDTSGSMSGDPIGLLRKAVKVIAGQLRAGDLVSMVTWNTEQEELLDGHAVAGPDDPELLWAADTLSANGGTDLHSGLVRGYDMAARHHAPGRVSRVVLISDGVANAGETDEHLIGQYADDEEGEDGIYLTGIGVGDGVNDTLLNVVTDAGRGAYVYLDTAAEAQKMLGDRFLSTIDLAARAVRLELTLPWYLRVAKFYGEAISTDPTKVRPQHLGPNDAMLFFQVLNACDASLLRGDDRIRLRATWEAPFTREARETTIDATLNDLAGDDAELTKAAAIAGYAEALIVAGRTGSAQHARAAVERALTDAKAANATRSDPDLDEVQELLETYLVTLGGF